MNHRILGIVKTFLLLLLVAGCTQAGDRSSTAQTTVTLSGWESDPTEKKLLQEVLAQFEAQHPEIKVKYEVITDQYMDVLKTRLIGGQAADVFYLDGFEAPALMPQGVLEPLDAYVTPEFKVNDFDPLLLNVFKAEGKTYGFPKDFSTLALVYNKKALRDAGFSAPPKTWAQLQQAAKKLTIDRDGDGKIDQYGLGIAPELARQTFMIKAFGGDVVNAQGEAAFASPQALKGLQLVIDQYQKDKTAVQPSDVGASNGPEMLGQGKVAMVLEGPWALLYLQTTFPNLEVGTAEVPTVNGKPGTMVYTVAYVMNKQAKNKQAAWKLISYLTGQEGMKTWVSKGLTLPTRQSVMTAMQYEKDSLRSSFIKGVDYGIPWQAGPYLPVIRTNFNNQFVSVLLGQQPLAPAMQKAQSTANQEIKASQ